MDRAAFVYRAGSRLARALPGRSTGVAATGLGKGAAAVGGQRRRIVERNLLRVRGSMAPGELDDAVEATFSNYAKYWIQSFRLPEMTVEEIGAGFRHEGFEHIQSAVEDADNPAGPILALPHLGGWEWAAFWLALVPEYKVTAVVERVESDDLFEWFVSFRERLGMDIVPLGPQAASQVMTAIRSKHVVCLLADRDIEGSGIEVEFFGERTTLPAGPATLALRTGAPLIPTVCYFDDDGSGVHAIARPPLDTKRQGRLRSDVERVTQDMAYAFEDFIRRAPEQWHLLQPNWPSDYDVLGLPRPG